MIRLIATVVAACSVALTGCAALRAEATRVHLGGKSFVELQLPGGWAARPVFVAGPATERVRVFNGTAEVMQVLPLRWSNQRSAPGADRDPLRAQAVAAIGHMESCRGASLRERPTPDGVALYCSPGGGTAGERIVGVLARPRMVAAFVFVDASGGIADDVLWRVIDSVGHFSFEQES